MVDRTTSPSAEDAENENGGIEIRSVSPAAEVEGNPGRLSATRGCLECEQVEADRALPRARVVR